MSEVNRQLSVVSGAPHPGPLPGFDELRCENSIAGSHGARESSRRQFVRVGLVVLLSGGVAGLVMREGDCTQAVACGACGAFKGCGLEKAVAARKVIEQQGGGRG